MAWEPLGWTAAWFSEIEPFPCAVLKHHYPDVPNLGDMTALPEMIRSGQVEVPDILCGGTPCQAFSVAGLRQSLDDERGNLSLTFCEIADAIDEQRKSIIFWENVPGVLSTKDNAFGCFLGALAGEDDALVPSGGRWANAGFVDGPKRAVAWRVLDAQYFGVAQRRRRVFVVASARADFDPAAVLFEFEGVRRDTAPSRTQGKDITGPITAGISKGMRGTEGVDSGWAIPVEKWPAEVACTLDTHFGDKQGLEDQHANAGCPLFVPVLPIALQDVTPREKAQNGKGWNDDGTSYTVDTAATQGVAQPIAFTGRDYGADATTDLAPTMRSLSVGADGHQSGSAGLAVAQAIGWSEELTASVELAGTIQRGGDGGRHDGVVQAVATGMQVRRLTPVECERLQGFPDNYTNIKDKCPDGPRYKALGNSWAVPVVRWIGERIDRALY